MLLGTEVGRQMGRWRGREDEEIGIGGNRERGKSGGKGYMGSGERDIVT